MSSSLAGAGGGALARQVNDGELTSDHLERNKSPAKANNDHDDDGRQLNLVEADNNSTAQALELKRRPSLTACAPSTSSSSPSSPVESQVKSAGKELEDERLHFLRNYFAPPREENKTKKNKPISSNSKFNQKKVRLAKQESILLDNQQQQQEEQKKLLIDSEKERAAERKKREAGEASECSCCWCSCKMFTCCCCSTAPRCLLISLLLLIIYSLAIYALPFVAFQPSIPPALPVVPFDYVTGPLKPTTASAYQVNHLFRNQLHGPESLAFDTQGNAYLAIEGGFILYAHLNTSSPIRRSLMEAAGISSPGQISRNSVELLKIAELNGPQAHSSQTTTTTNRRATRETSDTHKRECQLDEQVYGPHLYTTTTNGKSFGPEAEVQKYHFKSNVRVSRCSKPLGIRLSQDEQFLYVIDTLNGLYRINLRQPGDKLTGAQRQVTRLIDFKANQGQQTLMAVQLDRMSEMANMTTSSQLRVSRTMNVSLKALDDLVIDHRAGATGGDLIYMTVASQVWPATSFVYDVLEGRPSGLVLRLDTATQQLVVLEPARVAHVRSSSLTSSSYNLGPGNETTTTTTTTTSDNYMRQRAVELGAPRLDENDQFDDRPLNFPNGLELMDDKQALLIADTSNKRILKHYVRGPRAGTTDLWAWTPNFPDNIRRGYDKRDETYWVVGCGKGPAGSSTTTNKNSGHRIGRQQLVELNEKINSLDPLAMLRNWPRVRKFLMKNIYFMGATLEFVGANVLRSTSVQDMGYELRTGSSLCSNGCSGMMIVQYNARGDIIRSIHSREFPHDLMYYSQANELIDGQNAQHVLYLGSPSYGYLTKLVLPSELRAGPFS